MKKPSTGRRLARLGACAAAAGLVTVGAVATPALADGDQLWVTASPWQLVLPKASDTGPQPAPTTLNLSLSHDNPANQVVDGLLTVDVSGLAGIAEVTWPENCAPAGTTAVCSVPEVPATGNDSPLKVAVKVRAAVGAAVGASGRISYRATATTTTGEQLTAGENWTDVRVASGPDLSVAPLAPATGVTPGATVPVPVSAVNNGDRPVNGVRVTYYVTRGLTLGGLAPQCVGAPAGNDEGPIHPVTKVDCAYDDVVQPGGTFTLPSPVTATVAAYGLQERVDVGVQPLDGAEDLQPEDNGALKAVTVTNTADFAVRGARLTAAAGETVTAEVTFRNRGPAWVANLGSGDPVGRVDVTVPRGATATAVPDACEPRTADGGWWEGEVRTGAPRYVCNLPIWVAEKQTVTLPFRLRVDTVVTGAKGAVVLGPPYGTEPLPFDPNPANDRARIVLNPAA
ncbi:hypothetical protein ACFY8W_11805 [Streptomyces sp. NPDC012637]|uniref:hypothetical protein n=1 Tax=Streptomyces sp. NPDC012637 TaxID=3364842 RepID=UPI0036E94C96